MNKNGYIGRKMRQPRLKSKPAIIFTAFGSRRGKKAIEKLQGIMAEKYADHQIYWCYSSEIIRKREGLASLQQVLAEAEANGFRRAVVQPLHIFPGTEYQQICETCEFFPGMRVVVGETLMHRWDFIEEVFEVVEHELYADDEGFNIVALHGTPLSADPVSLVYLGIENMLQKLYPNVATACVEGIPGFAPVLKKLQREGLNSKYTRVKIIPLMFIAGIHVEDDLMGKKNSWKSELEGLGLEVSCPMVDHNGEWIFKGLAFYEQIIEFFIQRLKRSLHLVEMY